MLGYHGTSGPMKIADLQLTPLVEAFLDAGRELSYGVLDVNGANQLGNCHHYSLDFPRNFTPCRIILINSTEFRGAMGMAWCCGTLLYLA